eukprot:TRINITY_DN14468_c0_g1_i1.p1 TRINITY_DN14468_c0_g1~~TRINITY_DN14468_c0_g1_i1.p1  ORF type:complete len:736 (-),score=-45.20 TRINITY_DN14468_c0_g1_i1:104-2311(-)
MRTTLLSDDVDDVEMYSERPTRQRNLQTVTLVSILGCGSVIVALLIVVMVQLARLDRQTESCFANNTNNTNGSTADVPALQELSRSVLSSMDTSADPCQDFYQYSCGGWLQSNTIPGDKSVWARSFSVIDENNRHILKSILEEDWPIIGPFYSNCNDMDTINSRGISPLKPWLDAIDNVVDMNSLFSLLSQFHMNGIGSLFGFDVGPDPQNPSFNLASLYQGGIGLPNRDYYFKNDSATQSIQAAYRLYISTSLSLIGYNTTLANSSADKVIAFETSLAANSLGPADMRDPFAIYHKMSIQQLQQLTPQLPWSTYFSGMRPDLLAVMTEINVGMPNFTSGMEQLLVQTFSDGQLSLIQSYLQWSLLRSTAGRLSQPFLDAQFAWNKVLTGAQQPEARWKKCISASNSLLGELLGRYYVERAFPGSSKAIALELVDALETAFSQNLQQLAWMDAPTKASAQQKLEMITNKIGYPDNWTSYNSIFMSPGQYFENVAALVAFEANKTLNDIGQPVDKTQWLMSPPTVNAYYNPPANEIVFPAGILQPPFFNQSNPAWANFGGIGAVIGHEITHGFDDEGRQYDGTGNLTTWWPQSVIDAFLSKAQCVVDAYNNYEPLPGLFINGVLTEGENLADLGGVRIAYLAYQSWAKSRGETYSDAQMRKYFPTLTNDQLFFVSFGQVWCELGTDSYIRFQTQTNPHSWAKFRVIGALSNLQGFWDAFQCPAGTPMHPAEPCQVW